MKSGINQPSRLNHCRTTVLCKFIVPMLYRWLHFERADVKRLENEIFALGHKKMENMWAIMTEKKKK